MAHAAAAVLHDASHRLYVLTADDPATVRAAQDRVDFLLRRMARDLGEEREPGFRLWYEDVLGVFYRIDEGAMRVEVLFPGPSRRR